MTGPLGADSPGSDRRGVYFAFQGLLMAVLLLLFLYYPHAVEIWVGRFSLLLVALGGSLFLIHAAPARVLERWWFQMSLFVGDALLASLTLFWTEGNPDFFLLYLVILFGTALTRDYLHTLVVAALCTLLHIGSEWRAEAAFAGSTEFWLRLNFLWITASVLAILSRDTRQAQQEAQRQYQGRLAQLESLATLGQLAGEVAHRIKGPLTTIRVNAEIVTHERGHSPKSKRELAEILEEVDRCKSILKDLLDLGRIEEIDFERIDLGSPLRKALKSIDAQVKELGLEPIAVSPLPTMKVRGDQSLLYEAFFALLQNAVQAVGKKGKISVVAAALREGAPWWQPGTGRRMHAVSVEDDGAGIAREDLAKIFRPFYTTKGKSGTGLGLSAALRILQKHDGTIDAESGGPGRGALFTLKIPAL